VRKEPKLKIRKGATVEIVSGSDKGRKGSVLVVDAKAMKVKVQGVRIQTHFDRKDGIKKLEGFIAYSNVKLVQQAPAKAKPKVKTKATTSKAKTSKAKSTKTKSASAKA